MLIARSASMLDLSAKSRAPRHSGRGTGPVLLTLAGLAAAFGVASCCALPLLLATAGLGTAWLTSIALLSEPHRAFLLGAAGICLVSGGVLLWWQGGATACG